MTSAQDTWGEFGSKLSALGLKLKLHYEQEHAGEATDEADAGLKKSFERLGSALEDAFEALGNAAGDDALRADARDAGRLLLDGIGSTLAEVAGDLTDAFKRS